MLSSSQGVKNKSRAEEMRKTDLSDPLGLRSYRNRLALMMRLKEKGFYVRMHAYEYIVARGGSFRAIILLEPWRGKVYIVKLGSGVKEIVNIVREFDPSLDVEIVEPGSRG